MMRLLPGLGKSPEGIRENVMLIIRTGFGKKKFHR
jgi:hypothetical protein